MLSQHYASTKPTINLDFDNPAVGKILAFMKYISQEFKDEPNLTITLQVLECLMFIKLNYPWIKYAVENKEKDKTIYKYSSDKDKRVLRAHNDMSFHIISYNDATQAIADYGIIISAIENSIEKLIQNTAYAKMFIRKIQDSDVGCMENRLRPAMDFIVNPNILKLNDVFEDFFAGQEKLGITSTDMASFIPHLIKYFDSKLDEAVAHDGKIFDLNWNAVKTYLKENFGYDDELKPLRLFQEALIVKDKGWHLLYFPTKQLAEQYLRLIKISLPNDLYRETKKAKILAESKDNHIYYRFRLTQEQFTLINLSLNDEIRDLEEKVSREAKDNGHQKAAETIEEQMSKQRFESYALTLRKMPTDELYMRYLRDISALNNSKIIPNNKIISFSLKQKPTL